MLVIEDLPQPYAMHMSAVASGFRAFTGVKSRHRLGKGEALPDGCLPDRFFTKYKIWEKISKTL